MRIEITNVTPVSARYICGPIALLPESAARFVMGLSRFLSIQNKLERSGKRPERTWSRRFLRRKDEAADLPLKHNERSHGPVVAANSSPLESSQKTTARIRPAPLAMPTDPQDHCTLFQLPYELRLIIYELFLQKGLVLIADDWTSRIFRQNSRLLFKQQIGSHGSLTLRFAPFYQDDDDSITWCSETLGSQSRPYERDLLGDIIIKPYSTSLMSTCRRICDEMTPVLYSRKTLVLALPTLLYNLQQYLSPRSLAQIQHLHINQSWTDTDESKVREIQGLPSSSYDVLI